jgi:hypothetical protein
MPLADYQALVDKMVRAPDGTNIIATTDRDSAIEMARLRYSADADREITEDVVWTADGAYGPLPTGWTEGSWLKQAEFPIGEQPLALIELVIYQTPTERQLLAACARQAGDIVRVTYAAQHLLTDGPPAADTIPLAHREAVASYAASLLCAQLAAQFSSDRETSINADGSNTESRSRNYAQRSKELRAAYYAGIGKADPRADKSGGQAAQPTGEAAGSASAWPGRQRGWLTRGALL